MSEMMSSIGGTSIHVSLCAKHLEKHGIEVHILAMGELHTELDIGTAHFHSMGKPASQIVDGHITAQTIINSLLSICDEYKIDVVHAHYQNSMFAAAVNKAINRIPFVATLHGYEIQLFLMNSFQYYAAQLGLCIADHIISVSAALYKEVVDVLPCMAALPFSIIPDGTDISINVDNYKRIKATLGDRFTFVFVGRLSIEKGILELLEAFSVLEADCNLLLIGRGQLFNHIMSFIQEHNLGDRIKLVGEVPPQAVTDYIAAADVLVLPSYNEGLGTVVLEAFGSSTPVIGTNVGGIPEALIDNYNGLLIEPKDVDQLSKAMQQMKDDPDTYLRLKEGAIESSGKYTWEHLAMHHIEIYEELLSAEDSRMKDTLVKLQEKFDFSENTPWDKRVNK
jgi:glycosyltransferase involved in cell wall biosynthesis